MLLEVPAFSGSASKAPVTKERFRSVAPYKKSTAGLLTPLNLMKGQEPAIQVPFNTWGGTIPSWISVPDGFAGGASREYWALIVWVSKIFSTSEE